MKGSASAYLFQSVVNSKCFYCDLSEMRKIILIFLQELRGIMFGGTTGMLAQVSDCSVNWLGVQKKIIRDTSGLDQYLDNVTGRNFAWSLCSNADLLAFRLFF